MEKKVGKLQTLDLSYFLGKLFFVCDGVFQNMFVYQPTFSMLELKEDNKGTEYVIDWKSKEVYTSKLTPLLTAFLHNIKFLDIE